MAYNSRETLHVGSRLPSPMPAYCRDDGLCAARSRNCRPASCPCGDHAPSACPGPAATCQSSLTAKNLAATRCHGSIAGFSVSRPPMLRRHQCLPLGPARAGRPSLHLLHIGGPNDGAGAYPAQPRRCRPPCANRPLKAVTIATQCGGELFTVRGWGAACVTGSTTLPRCPRRCAAV
jgi:hypothetical protein